MLTQASPDIVRYGVPLPYDAKDYGNCYSHWADVPLPALEMRRRVLPERVVKPDGSFGGFVCFERPPLPGEPVAICNAAPGADGLAVLPAAR